jgi:hypothetical protein
LVARERESRARDAEWSEPVWRSVSFASSLHWSFTYIPRVAEARVDGSFLLSALVTTLSTGSLLDVPLR